MNRYFKKLIKILITVERTRSKVKIFGSENWEEEIIKIIDPKVLPTFWNERATVRQKVEFILIRRLKNNENRHNFSTFQQI